MGLQHQDIPTAETETQPDGCYIYLERSFVSAAERRWEKDAQNRSVDLASRMAQAIFDELCGKEESECKTKVRAFEVNEGYTRYTSMEYERLGKSFDVGVADAFCGAVAYISQLLRGLTEEGVVAPESHDMEDNPVDEKTESIPVAA